MACAGKVTPFRLIGRGLFEEVYVSISGHHGENFIFVDWRCDIFPSVSTFV